MITPVVDIVIDSPLWNAQRGVKAALRRAIAAAAAMLSTTDGELAIVLTDDSAIRALNRHWRGKDEPTNVLSFPTSSPLPPPLAGDGNTRLHKSRLVMSDPPMKRRTQSTPSPRRGEGGGEGVRAYRESGAPSPQPSPPWGEGAHRANVESVDHYERWYKTAPRLFGDIVIAYETTAREAEAEGKPLRDHLAHLAVHGFLHLVGYDHAAEEEAAAMEALEIAVLARLDVPDPYIAREPTG